MIQIGRSIQLAWRYLLGHFRRYVFLLSALAFGYAIIITMSSLSDGMMDKVSRTARFHYGGDTFVQRYPSDSGAISRLDDSLVGTGNLKDVLPEGTRLIRRTNYFSEGVVYFEGMASRQKNVFGVDWKSEEPELRRLDFIDGEVAHLDERAILLSQPVAKYLEVHVGEEVILRVKTLTGQVNTGRFTVGGVYREENIFGYYRSYVSKVSLNELIGFGADEYSSLGLYLPNGDDFVSPIIRDYLSNLDPETSLIGDKDEYNRERSGSWAGYRLFVIPLSVYISEVDDLVQAMRIGSYVVFIMIAIIVMVSVMVTYNLIIAERRKEVGTLRAMGFHKADILGLFLFEGLFLWLFALVGGGGLSVLLSYAISRISFDWIPGFSLFLENGRLLGLYRLESLAGNAVLLAVILVPALGIPVAKAVRRSIVECL